MHGVLLPKCLSGESKLSMAQAFRSTRVVTPQGLKPATLVVDSEQIAELRDWNAVPEDCALRDFGDLVLLPGLVDTHVRINNPGRAWEGFWTATRACHYKGAC